MLFAALVFDPASIATWFFVGLLGGWLTGKVLGSPSYGPIGDLLLGPAGGLVGGFIASLVLSGVPALWITALTAFISACVTIGVVRIVVARRNA